MATWSDVKELRLKVSDPAGVIDILSVANTAALPSSPARQTAYYKEDSGEYVTYDFDLAAWNDPCILRISDDRLENLIDLYGVAGSAPKVIRAILASLGQEIQIARLTKGADSTEYTTLKDTYEYYQMLIAEFNTELAEESGSSTGRYFRTRKPIIAGGDI